jgi:hypothetical protein
MSASDVEAGARWNERIQHQLNESRFGILCVTHENINSPWLLFEAGALAKTIEGNFVCPYLIGLEPVDLPQGPLSQFQAKRACRSETRDLLLSINQALGEQRLEQGRVDRGFDRWWPDLETALASLPVGINGERQRRPVDEVVEEVLLLVRGLDRRDRERQEFGGSVIDPSESQEFREKLARAIEEVKQSFRRYAENTTKC